MAKLVLFAAALLLAPLAVPVYASAPPPADCGSVIPDMIDCVDFVGDGGDATKPNADCCAAIKTVVGVSPACLCEGLQTAVKMGILINMTRAGALTEMCRVEVPGFHGCGDIAAISPAPAPGLPPSLSPLPSPSPSPSPPPSGSSPAPPVSPPLPTPKPPVPSPPSPVPSPALPAPPPLPAQPSPAPETPPVGSPIVAEAPSSPSASSRASTPLKLIAGAAAAGVALFVAV